MLQKSGNITMFPDNGIRCPSGTAITRLKNQGDADTGARYPQFNLNDDISGLTGILSISSALSVI